MGQLAIRNSPQLLAALALLGSVSLSAQTLHFEGVFDEIHKNTNNEGPFLSIDPIPFSFDITVAFTPSAPLSTDSFEGEVRSWQRHGLQEVESTNYAAPLPGPQLALNILQQDLSASQDWQASFSEAVFNGYPNPTYSLNAFQQTSRATGANFAPFPSYTQWSFNATQTWRTDGLSRPGSSSSWSAAWLGIFGVALYAPADYTPAEAVQPMTRDELQAFFEGFDEAGGVVQVRALAAREVWVPAAPENNDTHHWSLTGDFRLTSITPTGQCPTRAQGLAGFAQAVAKVLGG
jgi:hypothetical protein